MQVRDHDRELDRRFEELLGPGLLPGALLGQVPAVTGERTQPTDLLGGTKHLAAMPLSATLERWNNGARQLLRAILPEHAGA